MKKLSLLLLSLLFAFTAFANDTRNCQAPTNIVVTVEEDVPDYSYKYKVTVSWDAVEGAEGYNIYCLDGTYLLGTTNACFYYAGTDKEGSLDFRIATICYSGETSELSEPVIAVIGESSQDGCHAPENVNVLVEEGVQDYDYYFRLTFSWDPVPEAAYYRLYTDGNLYAELVETEKTDGLTEDFKGEDVTIEVQSICFSELTNLLTFPIAAGTYNAPENTNTTTGCATPENFSITVEENVPDYNQYYKITFSWDPVTSAEYYKLFVNGNLYKETTETVVVDGFSEAVTGVEASFAVMAVCASELSEPYEFIVTSVEEYETKFNVYPNPVNDRLFIETTEDIKEVIIYNIVGVPVYQGSNITNSIEVSNFSEGIYFVRITTDKGEATKKFIKK